MFPFLPALATREFVAFMAHMGACAHVAAIGVVALPVPVLGANKNRGINAGNKAAYTFRVALVLADLVVSFDPIVVTLIVECYLLVLEYRTLTLAGGGCTR